MDMPSDIWESQGSEIVKWDNEIVKWDSEVVKWGSEVR